MYVYVADKYSLWERGEERELSVKHKTFLFFFEENGGNIIQNKKEKETSK